MFNVPYLHALFLKQIRLAQRKLFFLLVLPPSPWSSSPRRTTDVETFDNTNFFILYYVPRVFSALRLMSCFTHMNKKTSRSTHALFGERQIKDAKASRRENARVIGDDDGAVRVCVAMCAFKYWQ